MKWGWKRLLFFICKLVFMAVVPLVIIYIGYGGWGESAKSFKIYFGVLVSIAVVFLVLKKVLFDRWNEKQKIKTGNLEADLEKENDQVKIIYIEEALRKARVIETVISWFFPALAMIILFLACRALERSIVTFSGIIGFIALSELVGFVFSILDAISVEGKHKVKEKQEKDEKN